MPKNSRRPNFNPDLRGKARLLKTYRKQHNPNSHGAQETKAQAAFRRRLTIASYALGKSLVAMEERFGLDTSVAQAMRKFLQKSFSLGSKRQLLESLKNPLTQKNPLALPIVRVYLHHPDPQVKVQAIKSLAAFNLKSEIPFIKRFEKNSDPTVKAAARAWIQRLGRSGK